MYARNVSMHLKANTAGEFTQTLEKDVLPLLRKQNGFNYSRDIYPQVLTSLAKVVEGTPTVAAFEVSNSTFHRIAARN